MSLTLSNCGQGEDLAGPDPAALRVTTETSGTGTDPDGYIVSIDGHQPVPVALVDTLLENGVTPGEHTVDLAGIAAGCSVEGGSFRSLTAVSGTTASTHFSVTCTAPAVTTGAVVIAVTTSGTALDPDGYLVDIDPSQSRPVETSGQVRIDGLSTGQQLVRLSGLAANCSVQGPNPVTVDVPPDGEVEVAFAVRCWPPASGRIAFVRVLEGVFGDLDTPFSLEVLGSDGAPRASRSFLDFVGHPAWSPTGDFVALILGAEGLGQQSVLVQPLAAGTAVSLPKCAPTGPRPSWSPDGSQLLCLSSPLEPDPENPNPTPRLVIIKRDGSGSRFLTPDDGTRVSGARYLADGRIFFVADEAEQEAGLAVFRIADDGTDLTRLCTLPPDVASGAEVVFSPDGQLLAYARSRPLLGEQWYVANIDCSNARLVSSNLELSVGNLVWSPDGGQLAFLAAGSVGEELWLASPDGSDLRRMPLPGTLGSGGFDWSPDGTRLVVSVTIGSDASIYTIRADGSGVERLTATESVDMDPAWGP